MRHALTALIAVLALCAPLARADDFTDEVVDEDTSRVTITSEDSTTAFGSILFELWVCRNITLERGFRYFAAASEGSGRGADGRRRWTTRLDLYDEVPEGRNVVDFREPSMDGASMNALTDARSLDVMFGPFDADWREQYAQRKADAAAARPEPIPNRVELVRERSYRAVAEGIRALHEVDAGDVRFVLGTSHGARLLDGDAWLVEHVPFEAREAAPIVLDGEITGHLTFHTMWIARLATDGAEAWQFPSAEERRDNPLEEIVERALSLPPEEMLDAIAGAPPEPMSFASADVDGDGRVEHAVGCNGGGGVYLLDDDGEVLWHHDAGNVFSIAFLDVDGDGRDEIVHVDDGLVVRDADGERVTSREGITSFTTLPSPDGASTWLAHERDGLVTLLDETLTERTTRTILARGVGNVDVAWLPWGDDDARPWSALSRTIGYTGNRSELYLFDGDGEQVWRREFATPHLPIASHVDPTSGDTLLLAGIDDALWAYRLDG